MSREDVELMRGGLGTLAEDGFEALLPLVHPDFEMTTQPGLAAEPQTYRGVEGMRRWWESFYEVMDEIRLAPREIVDAGEDAVIVEFELRATGQSSGLEVAQRACMLVHLRDGLMHRIELFATLAEARAAAG